MKKIKSIVLWLAAIILVSPVFSQSYVNKASSNTKISQLLKNNNTMLSVKYWELGAIDGEDKYKVSFHAVEVGDNQSSDISKGVKVVVFDDNKKTEAQIASLFYFDKLVTFIDVDEYEDIINSLNYMINTIGTWGQQKMDAADIFYKTNDNFIFGFSQEGKKQTGYMRIVFERVEFSCELKKVEKALGEMKEFMETASKDLYIKENLDKFKKSQDEEEALKKEAEKAKKEKEKKKKSDKEKTSDDENQL